MKNAWLVAVVLLTGLPLFAADVVVLRDGSQQSGTLELCADGQCRLSGKKIAMSEIRAIFFDGPRRELPSRSDAIILRDGAVRPGRVTFINRGTVDIDDEETDRSRVAAVVFSAGGEKALSDLLILRDGSIRSGPLTSCNAASCSLDNAVTPFTDIEWIGLARQDPTPPASSVDEVHKIDGTIMSGRLSGITAARVSTTRGALPRSEVAWIHLTSVAPPPPSSPPGAFGAPDSPPPAPPAQPPVQPPGPQQPPPPPPPQPGRGSTSPPPRPPGGWPPPLVPANTPPRLGALWTGRVQARGSGTSSGTYSQWDIDARVRLREKIMPLPFGTGSNVRSVGSVIILFPEGSVLTESYKCRGQGLTCRGEGTVTSSGEELQSCSVIWLKYVDYDIASQYQFDVPRSGRYSICLGIPQEASFDITYTTPDSSNTSPTGFISPVIGRHPELPELPYMDTIVRTFEGGVARMQGTYSARIEEGAMQIFDVSWSICRERVQCSAPPPLPPAGGGGATDPPADDNSDDCTQLQRLIDGIRALRDAYEAHEASFVEAERNRNLARDAIYGFSGTLAQFSLSLGSLALEAVGGAWGDLLGLLASGTGLAQQNDADNQLQAVIGITDTDIAFSPAESAGVRNAVKKADTYLAQTGDDQGALRVYSGELGRSEAAVSKGQKAVKGISVVVSIADYAQKTNGLADSIQKYADYYREANGHKANMDDTQRRMEETQREIDEVRERLDGPCPGIPSTGGAARLEPPATRSPYVLVQSAPAPATPLPVEQSEVRAVTSALGELETSVGRAMPWLLPFFARVTDGVSPRLLNALLRKAEPDLRAANTAVTAAIRAGRDVETRLGAAGGAGAGTAMGE